MRYARGFIAGFIAGFLCVFVAILGLIVPVIEIIFKPLTYVPVAVVSFFIDTSTTNGAVTVPLLALTSGVLYGLIGMAVQFVIKKAS